MRLQHAAARIAPGPPRPIDTDFSARTADSRAGATCLPPPALGLNY